MRFFIFVLVLLGPTCADKERIDDEDFPELASKLLIEIKKRLMTDYTDLDIDSSELAKYDEEQSRNDDCSFTSSNGTIIRTQDSISRGAEFIASLDNEKTPHFDREYCLQSCCETSECNLAVFKDKGVNHSCYMFNCGTPSVCLFTEHPGFSVHLLPQRAMPNMAQEKHADDLQNLALDKTETTTTTTTTTLAPTTTTTTTTTTSTTTTTTPTPTTASTTTTEEQSLPVALFGMCTEHKDCAGSFTQCLAGYCLCQENYHAQEGMCRKDCSRFEFECANEGQPTLYPQCIAVYDKCNGIKQCKDGSDEMNCDYGNSQVDLQVPKEGYIQQNSGIQNIAGQTADQQLPHQSLQLPADPTRQGNRGGMVYQQGGGMDRYQGRPQQSGSSYQAPQYPGQLYNYGLPGQGNTYRGSWQTGFQQVGQPAGPQQIHPPQQQKQQREQQHQQGPQQQQQRLQQQQQQLQQQQQQQVGQIKQPANSGFAQQPSRQHVITGHVEQIPDRIPYQDQKDSPDSEQELLPERGRIRHPEKPQPVVPQSSSPSQHLRKPGPGWNREQVGQEQFRITNPARASTTTSPHSNTHHSQSDSLQGSIDDRQHEFFQADDTTLKDSDEPQLPDDAETTYRGMQQKAPVPDTIPPGRPHIGGSNSNSQIGGGNSRNGQIGQVSNPNRVMSPNYNSDTPRKGSPNGYYRNSAGGYYVPGYTNSNNGGYRGNQYAGDYSQYYDPDQSWLSEGYIPDYNYNYHNMDTGYHGNQQQPSLWETYQSYLNSLSDPREPSSIPHRKAGKPQSSESDRWTDEHQGKTGQSKKDKYIETVPHEGVDGTEDGSSQTDSDTVQDSDETTSSEKTVPPQVEDETPDLSTDTNKNNDKSDMKPPVPPASDEHDSSEASDSPSEKEEIEPEKTLSESHMNNDSESKDSATEVNKDESEKNDDESDKTAEESEEDNGSLEDKRTKEDPSEGHLTPINSSPELENVAGNEISEAELSDKDKTVMVLSNKSAVVALALGLAITAVLLVFVGCRLRNMRRRLRKGRPLNSNEADYLINGMYL